MNCTHTQILLDAYADHALNAWQTVRVRRHLAGCAVCAAQLANIQHLQASVRAWRSVSAPAALEGRIAVALPRTASAPTPPHNRRVARRAAVGLAGVAAAIGVGFWFLPGHPAQPTVAFADVERAMQQVETLSWMTTVHTSFAGRTGHKSETNSTEQTWLRRRPAAIATLEQAKGYPKGLRSLNDGHGEILQYADNAYRTYKPHAKGDIAKAVEDEVRRMTQIPAQNVTSTPNASIRSNFLPLQEHETKLDGRDQILFVREGNLIVTTNPAPLRLIHISESVWVEPTTHRINQIEIENVGGDRGPNSRACIIYSNFHYNQVPPPGVFDWSPPSGASVEHH